jgi:hypothetical protein
MVSALLPLAIPIREIFWEYQTSRLPGSSLTSLRYAFCQLSYLARVSSLRASRRTVFELEGLPGGGIAVPLPSCFAAGLLGWTGLGCAGVGCAGVGCAGVGCFRQI